MSNEVKRYDPINSDGTCGMCIEDADYGAYVEYADYAALEAENAKLRAELERRVPDGCLIVPIQPTEEMRKRAQDYLAAEGMIVSDWLVHTVYTEMLAADALEAKAAPVAYITGQFAGRCIIEPINRAAVLPTGMALYSHPQTSAGVVMPEGYALVPQRMHLSEEAIESITVHCGDGQDDAGYGPYQGGVLWVGEIEEEDGTKTYGLHIATADYPEHGSTTLAEFARLNGKGVGRG